MQPNSSQTRSEANCNKNEETSVEKEQSNAVSKMKDYKVRRFRQETVVIETIGRTPLYTKLWITDENLATTSRKEEEAFKCLICTKKFDKKQKLISHQRIHTDQ